MSKFFLKFKEKILTFWKTILIKINKCFKNIDLRNFLEIFYKKRKILLIFWQTFVFCIKFF